MNLPSLGSTLDLMMQAHAGQVDKGGFPYYLHPIRVMTRLPAIADEWTQHLALLHDVVEDTHFTYDHLKHLGYPMDFLSDLAQLERPEGITYMDWIREIAASSNLRVILVKYGDNLDNSDPKRLEYLPEDKRDIVHRYERSMKILLPVIQRLTSHRVAV